MKLKELMKAEEAEVEEEEEVETEEAELTKSLTQEDRDKTPEKPCKRPKKTSQLYEHDDLSKDRQKSCLI